MMAAILNNANTTCETSCSLESNDSGKTHYGVRHFENEKTTFEANKSSDSA